MVVESSPNGEFFALEFCLSNWTKSRVRFATPSEFEAGRLERCGSLEVERRHMTSVFVLSCEDGKETCARSLP